MEVPISTQAVPNMKGAQIFRRSAWEGGRGYRESTASLINQYPSTSYRQGALRDDGLLVEDFQMRVQSHARVCQQLSEGYDSWGYHTLQLRTDAEEGASAARGTKLAYGAAVSRWDAGRPPRRVSGVVQRR
jgi:hypothetical protein